MNSGIFQQHELCKYRIHTKVWRLPVCEMLDMNSVFTWLITHEGFVSRSHCDTSKFYKSEWGFFHLLNLHYNHTSAMPSNVFIITCWMWGSSLVGLVPPCRFFSILGPGFCCTCGSGSGCGCRGACRLELRPQAHSQSLLSSISESARLSWITGNPLTNTMVLRTLSYVVTELMFWRFAGPQSDVGWHSSRTLWKVLVIHIAEFKGFLAIIVFWIVLCRSYVTVVWQILRFQGDEMASR